MTAEQLLENAAQAQSDYWDALLELETALDIEIDDGQDLSGLDVETLIELCQPE